MALNIEKYLKFSYTKCSDRKAEALFKGNIIRDYVCLYAVSSRLASKISMLCNPKLDLLQGSLEYISNVLKAEEDYLRESMGVMSREESKEKELRRLERKYPS